MTPVNEKLKNFISEPIRDKPVTKLPGIGVTLGSKLADAGFGSASSVLGQFLLFKMDREYFCDWMHEICQANNYQAEECWNCLIIWCYTYL
ncbi:barrier-to-autointegration factor-like [Drosophila rhopaloa]|uniref:Barrier-to-autointegration factor-like n=1 Tax=Drosophila rhopaloa TaxID=1041015 RepID=A0A6P4FFE9_DRORH|nr:barrier-to-autointegration factor-like [Drosophila rhopaloa]